ATAEDVSQATQAFNWSGVTYDYLGASGDAYLRAYYIDYPLLYANVFHNTPVVVGQGASPVPYLQSAAIPASGESFYVVRCVGGNTANLIVDGNARQVTCEGAGTTSAAFYAGTSVAAAPGAEGTFDLYTLRRYVF